ncbi:hypothetical protein ACSBR1_008635 [Camellia fascicularis]
MDIGILRCMSLLVVVIIAMYCVLRLIIIKREDQAKIERFLEDYKVLKPARYSYADIKNITNKFKDKRGQGGYGIVYKGKLSNDVHVAVKILDNVKGNGDEFINEVGTIGTIHHINNVVRLVGYCADGFKRALVYEFLPNHSLEKFILSKHEKNSLGWEKLHDIALGIAKGIDYLHQGCNQRILHFDIKPHNILLDHNFNPKISDFGLAKLCSKEQSVVSMTAARGTVGYIAPEVFSRNFGKVSCKSDVYSFGMLLLEMVGQLHNISGCFAINIFFVLIEDQSYCPLVRALFLNTFPLVRAPFAYQLAPVQSYERIVFRSSMYCTNAQLIVSPELAKNIFPHIYSVNNFAASSSSTLLHPATASSNKVFTSFDVILTVL